MPWNVSALQVRTDALNVSGISTMDGSLNLQLSLLDNLDVTTYLRNLSAAISASDPTIVTNLSENFWNLSGQFTTLSGDVYNLSDGFWNLSSQFTTLSGDVYNLSDGFWNLSSQFTTLSGDVYNLSDGFWNLSSQFTTLSGDVYNLSSQFTTLSGDVYNLSSQFTTLSGDVYNLSSQFTTLSGDVYNLSDGFWNLSGQFANLSGNAVTYHPSSNSFFLNSETSTSVGSVFLTTSLDYVSTATNLVVIGADAAFDTSGAANLTGSVIIGASAGYLVSSSINTPIIAIGPGAATGTAGLGGSVAIGSNAGTNIAGVDTITIGTITGQNAYGDYGILMGSSAGSDSSGNHLIAIGSNAGFSSAGATLIAIGKEAGTNSTIVDSIVLGQQAGVSAGGVSSILMGLQTGYNTTTPVSFSNAVAIGNNAAFSAAGTFSNTVHIGYQAGNGATDNIEVIAIGATAGQYNTSAGSNSIFIGSNAGGGGNAGSNVIALGNDAANNGNILNDALIVYSRLDTCDNALLMGDLSLNKLGVGLPKTTLPTYSLDVCGDIRVSQPPFAFFTLSGETGVNDLVVDISVQYNTASISDTDAGVWMVGHYCKLSGNPTQTTTPITNAFTYVSDNIWWVHGEVTGIVGDVSSTWYFNLMRVGSNFSTYSTTDFSNFTL